MRVLNRVRFLSRLLTLCLQAIALCGCAVTTRRLESGYFVSEFSCQGQARHYNGCTQS